jgi:hypothetical protein
MNKCENNLKCMAQVQATILSATTQTKDPRGPQEKL